MVAAKLAGRSCQYGARLPVRPRLNVSADSGPTSDVSRKPEDGTPRRRVERRLVADHAAGDRDDPGVGDLLGEPVGVEQVERRIAAALQVEVAADDAGGVGRGLREHGRGEARAGAQPAQRGRRRVELLDRRRHARDVGAPRVELGARRRGRRRARRSRRRRGASASRARGRCRLARPRTRRRAAAGRAAGRRARSGPSSAASRVGNPAARRKSLSGGAAGKLPGCRASTPPPTCERLRIPEPVPPSADALRALHRAHVERIAYEALEIQLGRPTSVDPHEAADRILSRHRGGYCFHLNGAFSLLLEALGYDVMWHRAGVQNHRDPEPVGSQRANHLALTVHGLPAEDARRATGSSTSGWATRSTRRCRSQEGAYVQGPFRYALRRSQVDPGGWRWDHDPAGSFAGVDFRAQRATQADFRARHEYLSTLAGVPVRPDRERPAPRRAAASTCSPAASCCRLRRARARAADAGDERGVVRRAPRRVRPAARRRRPRRASRSVGARPRARTRPGSRREPAPSRTLSHAWARSSSSRTARASAPPAPPRAAARAAGRASPRPRWCSAAAGSPAPSTRSGRCARSTCCRSTARSTSSTSTSARAPARSSPR